VGDVARLVLGDALRLGVLGVAIGLAAAVLATGVLERLLYGVTATDPLTFAATAVLLMVVTVIAALAPAVRAARVSPTEAIRAE
jgi:ABC-type antimicrobial peptide transport system permease subunit